MESERLIRLYDGAFSRGDIDKKLRNKIKMYEGELTHIPQHSIAVKSGLDNEDCDDEREMTTVASTTSFIEVTPIPRQRASVHSR